MTKPLIISFIAIFLLTPKEDKPLIEIYFLKSRIAGIENPNWPPLAARPFIATRNDLTDTPFIHDFEILGYDSSSLKLKFSPTATKRITDLSPPIGAGIQFVISVDKEPVLNGYFVNKYTSIPALSYMIMNSPIDSLFKIDKYIPGDTNENRKNNKLLNAFYLSNRLN